MSRLIPCFIHIPKTAGCSLRTLMTLNYAPGEVASIYGDLRGILDRCSGLLGRATDFKLIQGHFPHGTHLNLGLRSARYFSFLRHPVDRLFSDAAHGFRDRAHEFHALLVATEKQPLGWATLSDQCRYFRNLATHYLSGVFFCRDLDYSDFHRAVQVVLDSEFIGIAERFNESVLIMARKLGWSRVVYEKRNVASNAQKQVITPEMRAACEARQQFDLPLYRIACDRFDQDVRAHGSLLQEAAHQLEELVLVQSKMFPQLESRGYLVGDPVLSQPATARSFPAQSPLARWLRGENSQLNRSRPQPIVEDPQLVPA